MGRNEKEDSEDENCFEQAEHIDDLELFLEQQEAQQNVNQ